LRLFIAPRTGTGTRADAYRPDIVLDDVGGVWGAFEMPDGRFTCVAPNATVAPANTVDLGDDPEAPLPAGTMVDDTTPAAREVVDVSGLTVGEAILTIDGNFQPDDSGRVQVIIAGVVLYDAPAIQGGATDTFSYADNASLATVSGGAWVNHVGLTFGVASGHVITQASSWYGQVRWSTAVSTTQYSQIDVIAASTAGGYTDGVVWTRMTTSGETGFVWALSNDSGTKLNSFYRATAGSFAQTFQAAAASNSATIKLESTGSSHKCYYNGTLVTTQSDTAFPSNTYVGFASDTSSNPGLVTLDNWFGGDIPTATGTINVTLDAVTSSAAGTPTVTGTIGVTLEATTMVAAGPMNATGTIDVTLEATTMAAAGTPTVAGTISVTLDAVTMTTPATLPFPYPVAVSGRKIVDQNGNQYLIRNIAIWGAAQNASNSEITSALTSLAGSGFKSVMVWPCGGDYGGAWDRYHNKAGAAFFTGTALQSTLGPAWSSMDWVMTEATRLNLTVIFAVAYTGDSNTQGIGNDLIAAGTTHAYNHGVYVATRYASYPNIVWHHGADSNYNYGASVSLVVDAMFHGIRDVEGSTHRLVLAEPSPGGPTSYQQWISQQGTSGTGYEWLKVSANSVYDYSDNTVDQIDGVYTQTGATTLPVWDSEIPYRGASWTGTPTAQELRERLYSTFIRGGIGVNYGDADMWPMGLSALGSGGSYTTVVAPTLTRSETIEAANAYTFCQNWIASSSWAPNDSFITTGTGTGVDKAAAGSKGNVAIAYFPGARTIAVDTTVITGTGPVRLRWWDPVAFTYTDISTSEAQQTGRSVTLPAARGDSSRDFVLVVDQPAGGAFIGTTPITNLRIGTTAVTKLYVGTTQIV
jgi:hypothetical protein